MTFLNIIIHSKNVSSHLLVPTITKFFLFEGKKQDKQDKPQSTMLYMARTFSRVFQSKIVSTEALIMPSAAIHRFGGNDSNNIVKTILKRTLPDEVCLLYCGQEYSYNKDFATSILYVSISTAEVDPGRS